MYTAYGSKSSDNATNAIQYQILRGATQILFTSLLFTNTTLRLDAPIAINYVDAPNTTSATTYKLQFKNNFNGASVSTQTQNLTILEVEA